jgi:DNA-directed RNA polymerase subunit RPC12/RpoP
MNKDNRHRGYLMQFACFECRKAFKQPVAFPSRVETERHVCPECGAEMTEMGRNFRAPKLNDIEQWKKVKAIIRNGLTFHSTLSDRVGEYPERLREVEAFIATARKRLGRISLGEELLRKIERREGTSSARHT